MRGLGRWSLMSRFPSPQDPRNLRHVGEKRVSDEPKARKCTFPCLLITRSTSIGHDDRDIAEVSPMADRGLDADLSSHTGNDESVDPAITKRDVQRGALES